MRSTPLPSDSLSCGEGAAVFVGQDAFCVYLNSPEDVQCPEGVPHGHRLGGSFLCSDDPSPPPVVLGSAVQIAQGPPETMAPDTDALLGSVESGTDEVDAAVDASPPTMPVGADSDP